MCEYQYKITLTYWSSFERISACTWLQFEVAKWWIIVALFVCRFWKCAYIALLEVSSEECDKSSPKLRDLIDDEPKGGDRTPSCFLDFDCSRHISTFYLQLSTWNEIACLWSCIKQWDHALANAGWICLNWAATSWAEQILLIGRACTAQYLLRRDQLHTMSLFPASLSAMPYKLKIFSRQSKVASYLIWLWPTSKLPR